MFIMNAMLKIKTKSSGKDSHLFHLIQVDYMTN